MVRTATFLLLAALAAGCGSEPGRLGPLPLHADAADLGPADRALLAGELARYFGPPGAPRYLVLEGWSEAGFDPNGPAPTGRGPELERAVADDNAERFFAALRRLERGEEPGADGQPASLGRALERSADPRATLLGWQPDLLESALLFARECAVCHGDAGGGDGPSAASLVPPPRDFRSGEFVHRGPDRQGPRPSQDELVRVLRRGVAGAGMPLFARLGAARQSGLADWVRYLSLRGEVERAWLDARSGGAPPGRAEMDAAYVEAWSRWAILPGRAGDAQVPADGSAGAAPGATPTTPSPARPAGDGSSAPNPREDEPR